MKIKTIALIFVGLLAVLLLAVILVNRDHPDDLRSGVTAGSIHPRRVRQGSVSSQQSDATRNLDTNLLAALSQSDSARRSALLDKWAAAVGTGAMGRTLEGLGAIEKPELRSEVRGVLLSSWAGRDVPGMAGWFGNRYAADALHQQVRDTLVRSFVSRDPGGMLSWMQQSLPESVRGELYGPFFRQWAAIDPAAAGDTLRQLSGSSREDPARAAQWNDIIAQVAAVWVGTDPGHAVEWVQSLPDGAAKSKALVQISYQWVAVHPQAAAAYAARQNDPVMLKAVVGRWAENDPAAAAAYAAGLPGNQAQSQAVLAVVSSWASVAPAQAAQWVGQFPENPMRGQALEQLMRAWSEQDASAAGQWLQTLPQVPSRDAAVCAYSGALGQSDLPERTKKQLLANVIRPGQK